LGTNYKNSTIWTLWIKDKSLVTENFRYFEDSLYITLPEVIKLFVITVAPIVRVNAWYTLCTCTFAPIPLSYVGFKYPCSNSIHCIWFKNKSLILWWSIHFFINYELWLKFPISIRFGKYKQFKISFEHNLLLLNHLTVLLTYCWR